MRMVLLVFAVLVAIAIVIVVVGWSLPVAHSASRQATYAASSAAIYAAIATPEDFPAWRSKVKSVEVLSPSNGLSRYREIGSDGTILYVVGEALPGRRLVTRIADKSLPFGGSWTYSLAPAGNGTTLRITEDGEVYNVVFRVISRYVFGHHATLDAYLRDLGKRLGEPVTITDAE